MPPPIAILGAGPGGLALARLLEMKSIDYVVFERDRSPDEIGQGGTLDVHTGSGQLVLQECGLFEEFKTLARYDGQAFKAVDKDCNIICDQSGEGEDDRPEIDRKQLRTLLLDSIPSEKVRWDHRIESVDREADDLMSIRFSNGSVESGFELVVGTDGAWSKARNMITDAKPRYSGVCSLQTTISPSNASYSKVSKQCGRGTYMAISDGQALIVQRLSDGSYNVYVSLHLPEDWSKTEASQFLSPHFREQLVADNFRDWASDITDLIKLSDDGPFHNWRLYTLPSESLSWKPVPGVTLIGDAAHVSLPNGEGVNCAMYDSFLLMQQIVECGLEHLDEAVKRYEEDMLPRGVAHIKDGEEMSKLFYAADSPKDFRAWAAEVGLSS